MIFGQVLALTLASTVVAVSPSIFTNPNSKYSLPFAVKINATGFRNIVDADRARAATLSRHAEGGFALRDGHLVNVANGAVIYLASVGVGSPQTQCTCILVCLLFSFTCVIIN
jgi:hypothetical protein